MSSSSVSTARDARKNTYKSVDMVFPFAAELIDQYTGWMEEAPVTKVQVLYSELILRMMTDNCPKGWSERQVMYPQSHIEQFQKSLVRTLSDHCDSGLKTLKFHLLHHAVEYFQAFSTMAVLYASPFQV